MFLYPGIQLHLLFSVSISSDSSFTVTDCSTHHMLTHTNTWLSHTHSNICPVPVFFHFTCTHMQTDVLHASTTKSISRMLHTEQRISTFNSVEVVGLHKMTSGFPSSHHVQQEITMAPHFSPLSCHWQSAFPLGYVISPAGQCVNDVSLVRYGFARSRLQHPRNMSTTTTVPWAVL